MAKRQRTNNHLEVEVEDTTGAIRIRKSKKDRQHNGQKVRPLSFGHCAVCPSLIYGL
jgi:hypothetical protein